MIEIEQSAALNTVQDTGRYGWRDIGVSVSGAMDSLALRAGNILLNNPQQAAAIEIQMFPFRVRFLRDTAIAITGADCRALLDGKPLLPWSVRHVRQGEMLELRFPRQGARGYLCVAGGIDVPEVLGSRSTALRGEFGGHEGRALKRGDILNTGDALALNLPEDGLSIVPPAQALAEFFPVTEQGELKLRVIPSGEFGLFTADSDRIWQQSWKISMQSNRTGYRLNGAPLRPSKTTELRSYGLIPGIIQVPPAGEPIIQLSDANTAGGYPKLACVIEQDLWRLGQLQPGQSVWLVESSAAEARRVQAATEQWLNTLKETMRLWGNSAN